MIVSDSSPVIALAHIGRLDLLGRVFDEVVIPEAVEEEITRHPDGFSGARPSWIRVQAVGSRVRVEALRGNLGRGETEAIALAAELGAGLLIDDGPGRQAATSLGLEIVGTLGALLRAKLAGVLPEVTPLLLQLRLTGFRVSQSLLEELRVRAGE